ncbi:hypothetical protein RclHR1_20680001 [Rhizophagus clarus]|uniref:MIR domain-containing protein n=1 Tax=Rhizophagus clarus TaxID=94130 RepID=A0A2Z6QR09_9GLOM|nr:hypothetical protein RclHR1_20680001 [Rhizophagus clarus]GES94980.1 hypothetical protein GLOIN_2v1544279 [Rhizophagus clarus]
MNLSKYDGNIHPDAWINDVKTYLNHKGHLMNNSRCLMTVKSLIDPTIKLPNGIDSFEKLCNALKEDITFIIFKNTNKRVLNSLKYVPEKENGKTSKFIYTFRKLCYNAEINDIGEQKKYFYKTLPNYNYFLTLFNKKEQINSMNDLIREFEKIIMNESDSIKNDSIVTLKHVATGKYLSSIKNLCYTTGSKTQLVFAKSTVPDQDCLWKIKFNKEFATYTDTFINFQHINSNTFLGIYYYEDRHYVYNYYESPKSEHIEVSCCGNYDDIDWKFYHSKSENHRGYLKSNDTINLSTRKSKSDDNRYVFLRNNDITYTIGEDTFQEIICHNEKLGENDEWCIESLFI